MKTSQSLIKRCASLWLALTLLHLPVALAQTQADDCTKPVSSDSDATPALFAQVNACIGSTTDTQWQNLNLSEDAATSGRELIAAVSAQQQIVRQASNLRVAEAREALQPLNDRYVLLIAALESEQTRLDIAKSSTWALANNGLTLPALDSPLAPKVDLIATLEKACKAGDCQTTFDNLIRVSRAIVATDRTVDRLNHDAIGDTDAQAKVNAKTWQAYQNDAPVQYLWELFANSLAIQRFEPLCTHDQVAAIKAGKKVDCRSVGDAAPKWMISIMHPEVMAEYADSPESAEDFKPGIHLEAIGYNWLRYEDDGSLKSVYGISAGLLYTERNSISSTRPAIGLRFGESLAGGISFGDGTVGVFVNAKLGDLFESSQQTVDQYFGRFKR